MTVQPNFESLRTRGRQAARRAFAELAPYDTLDRVAWASGWVREDCLIEAIERARAAGIPGSDIEAAAGSAGVKTDGASGDKMEPRYRARRRRREES